MVEVSGHHVQAWSARRPARGERGAVVAPLVRQFERGVSQPPPLVTVEGAIVGCGGQGGPLLRASIDQPSGGLLKEWRTALAVKGFPLLPYHVVQQELHVGTTIGWRNA